LPVAALEVSRVLLPAQKVLFPLMTGVAGLALMVTVSLVLGLSQPLTVWET
jgi:hypothetical protein